MSAFEDAWNWALTRGTFQQDKLELEHVFNLMKGCDCDRYLEVGSAEGNSLYILGHAAKRISYIDIGEAHTDPLRADAIAKLGKPVEAFIGDSTLPKTHNIGHRRYDCILIDGGHDFATVLSDSFLYAPLAMKYVFWHDIQLPEVHKAVEWFIRRWRLGNYGQFINSSNYGYGILEVKNV